MAHIIRIIYIINLKKLLYKIKEHILILKITVIRSKEIKEGNNYQTYYSYH